MRSEEKSSWIPINFCTLSMVKQGSRPLPFETNHSVVFGDQTLLGLIMVAEVPVSHLISRQ